MKKQEKLLELYEKLADHRSRVIHTLLDDIVGLGEFYFNKEDVDYTMLKAKHFGYEDDKIVEEIAKIKELER